MTKPVTFEEGDDQWRRWRKRCREDLYFLNAMVLGYGSLVPMTPRVHLPLCRFAERKTGIPEIDEARIQLIHIGRGTGKTTCVTIGRTVQRILQNRDWAAGIANETHPNACAMLGVIKSHFESNDLLRKLFPELIPPSFRDTAWRQDRIIVNRTPSGKRNKINPTIRAAGVDSTVTGVHMNEWILDDLISDDAAKAAAKGVFTAIEDANGWIRRVQPLLTRPKQDPITIIGTPWWPGDTYDFIQEHWGDPEDVRTFLWTLKLPGGDHFSMKLVRSGELALFKMPMRDEKGRAIWPEGGLDDESLQAMEAEDPLFFGAQYMLEPSEGEALSFKKEWLKPFEWDSSQHLVFDGPDGKTTFEHLQTLDVVLSVDLAH
ncbi:MAG: hypothetical protein R3268_13805, partial [Acidiferrobacterales bacterium]|nr:hypothetical protein [Acidiferrobacterales bacterium]